MRTIEALTRWQFGGRRGGASLASALSQSRIDFVGIGDSNWLFSTHGWDQGFLVALGGMSRMYGTGLVTVNEAGGTGSGVGNPFFGRTLVSGTFASTGAPGGLNDFLPRGSDPTPVRPHSYAFRAAGDANMNNFSKGMVIQASPPFDPLGRRDALLGHAWIGGFADGAGSVRLAWRTGTSGSPAALGEVIASNAVADGEVQKFSLAVGATASNDVRSFLFGFGSTHPLVAPFFATYQYAENPSHATGYRSTVLRGLGGESMRGSAAALIDGQDKTLVHFFQAVRDGQRDQLQKKIIMLVNHGLNGRVGDADNVSLGPAAHLPGNDGIAFVDNFVAIKNRIEGIWTAQEWPLDELQWVVFVSHPTGISGEESLIEYRAAMQDYANATPRVQAIDLSQLTTADEMLAQGWYQSGGADRSHLTAAGFEALAARIVSRIRPAA
jgi:hypothetical protein